MLYSIEALTQKSLPPLLPPLKRVNINGILLPINSSNLLKVMYSLYQIWGKSVQHCDHLSADIMYSTWINTVLEKTLKSCHWDQIGEHFMVAVLDLTIVVIEITNLLLSFGNSLIDEFEFLISSSYNEYS